MDFIIDASYIESNRPSVYAQAYKMHDTVLRWCVANASFIYAHPEYLQWR